MEGRFFFFCLFIGTFGVSLSLDETGVFSRFLRFCK